jgi:phosphoglycerate dehydrogenase-like enzyme
MAAVYAADTDKLLSRDAIAAMKPSAYVINVARGPLVDEDALFDALAAKRIAGAGRDVTAVEPLPPGHRLWSMANVLLTAHRGRRPRRCRKHRVRRHQQPPALDCGRAPCEGRHRPNALSVRRFGR